MGTRFYTQGMAVDEMTPRCKQPRQAQDLGDPYPFPFFPGAQWGYTSQQISAPRGGEGSRILAGTRRRSPTGYTFSIGMLAYFAPLVKQVDSLLPPRQLLLVPVARQTRYMARRENASAQP
jgi:hypothetical protein